MNSFKLIFQLILFPSRGLVISINNLTSDEDLIFDPDNPNPGESDILCRPDLISFIKDINRLN